MMTYPPIRMLVHIQHRSRINSSIYYILYKYSYYLILLKHHLQINGRGLKRCRTIWKCFQHLNGHWFTVHVHMCIQPSHNGCICLLHIFGCIGRKITSHPRPTMLLCIGYWTPQKTHEVFFSRPPVPFAFGFFPCKKLIYLVIYIYHTKRACRRITYCVT